MVFGWLNLGGASGLLKKGEAALEAGDVEAGFKLVARAAQAKLPAAEYRVGLCYLQGKGVPASRKEGRRWLELAATQGHGDAQSAIATLLITGEVDDHPGRRIGGLFADSAPTQPDFIAAEGWARRAAEGGSAEAQALLGYILTAGPEAIRNLDQAEHWYRRSSEGGNPQGKLGLGLAVLRRAGTDAEQQKPGIEAITAAAELGLPMAQYLQGVLLEHGVGLPQDAPMAVVLYQKAANTGLRSAMARLGLALLEGRGGKKPDPITGESWLRRAALAGDVEAAAMVGDLYAKGGDLPPNFAEAAVWFQRAAEGGHAMAARALGMLYLTGAGVPRNADEAAVWFDRAAASGNTASQVDLANLVLQGSVRDGDPDRMRSWFEQAAESGDLVAAFNFSVCLARGFGVDRDPERAAFWMHRAADGIVNAQFHYGRMLLDGSGVPMDPVAARAWFAKASDAGMADAQVALAEMLVNGRGGDRNHFEAARMFQRAADLGHGGAMFGLGALYGGGHDVPVDRAAALHWFRQAAERSHPTAQLMLGRYLHRGLASPPDREQARIWFKRALDSGVAEAAAELAQLNAEQASETPAAPGGLDQPAADIGTATRATGPQLIHN
ncbi:SEL1-like repeat protein [Acidisoma silvae]|uniref:SEL1-like repeat protein n=1 Tax=Acidisoma silvae TaxID=2802396 RepID=A0A963YNA7_9PROT|nr:SEL1-like repeat protein [Acidisoma silvae]MCB8874031.1 SEL1-like repeat protein [Acidisoma silvae]